MSEEFLLRLVDLIEKDEVLREATVRLINAIACQIEIKNEQKRKSLH